jgi:hypothetical protein
VAAKAHACSDRAVEWMERNQPRNAKLRRFRAEAEEPLKLEKNTD